MQQTPDFCCPCGGFLGWKQIRLSGKSLSRSYGDLRGLGQAQAKGWAWETTENGRELVPPKPPVAVEAPQPPAGIPPGTSALEKLPSEVLSKFLILVISPISYRSHGSHGPETCRSCILD